MLMPGEAIQMHRNHCRLAALLLSALPCVLPAATVNGFGSVSLPGFSTGTLGPVGATPAPNNDDDPGLSPNVIPYSVFLNSPGSVEVEFLLADSGGTTEYRFTQGFVNTRSAPWTGFRFELGFGTGADFVKATSGSGLRFDELAGVSTATSPVFTLVGQQPAQLDWSVPAPPFAAPFVFAVDVPDGLERFTLRQTPLVAGEVPEPAGTAVAGTVALAVGYTLRRRRR